MELAEVYLLIALAGWVKLSFARENSRLFYYETMSKISETTRSKRSSASNAKLAKELQFHAFRRDFHLSLTSGSSVLAEGFQARMIHADGSSTRFTVDQSKLFTGRVVHSKQSMVSAFLEEELWNINIFEHGEAFAIEPAWRLLAGVDNPHNDTMVTYRLSDVKDLPNNNRFCGAPPDLNRTDRSMPSLGNTQGAARSEYVKGQRFRPARQKRNAKNTCLIHLVGDASLFEKRCRRNHNYCASMMIQYLQVTDDLFRSSKFEDREGNSNTGFGLQVRALRLHAEYNNRQDPSLGRHFNDRGYYNADQKLDGFAHYMYKTQFDFCLHHLLSEFEDHRGVLGLAYTRVLCGVRNSEQTAFNTGVSSGTNSDGTLIPSLMANLVFSHEISHNFGSMHDANTVECAPEDRNGGKYIMWPYAVRGNRFNNKALSKCSLRKIGREIPAWCFVDRTKLRTFCGNGLVEGDEQCDAGTFGLHGKDKCCTSDCNFQDGANCSDSNHECCENCRIAPKGRQCWSPGYSYSCKNDSQCTGNTLYCPEGKTKPDGELCGFHHTCFGGECMGPCQNETKRMDNGTILMPCSCTRNASELCMFCCYDSTRAPEPGACRPIIPQHKPNGSECFGGICRGGYCDQTPVSSTAILEHYIRHLAQVKSITKFMEINCVMVVVLLTLLVWVPASFIISYIDKKDSEEREMLFEELALERLRMRRATKANALSYTRLIEQGHVASTSSGALDHVTDQRPAHPGRSAALSV